MISMEAELTDKIIVCQECGAEFIFSIGNQLFFKAKNLSQPKRCKACVAIRKAKIVPDSLRHTCETCFYKFTTPLCTCREIADMKTSGNCNDWREGNSNDNKSKR